MRALVEPRHAVAERLIEIIAVFGRLQGIRPRMDHPQTNVSSQGRIKVSDVRCRDQVEAMAQYAIDTYGRIDVLINDAGIMPVAYYSDYAYAMEPWEECLDTALKGTLYATCAVYDQMIKQGRGHVINISSILGNLAVNGSAIYNASKAGVRFMAESLRTEASGKIKTTVIRPSSVPTTGLADTVLNIYASLDGMYGKAFEAMAAPHPEAGNRDSIHFKAPDANDLADNIIYAINQPWGVSISDITVRSSGECMFV